MNPNTTTSTVLGILHPEDLEVLLNLSFRKAFTRDEVLVAAGEFVDHFYLVESGGLRMEGDPNHPARFLGAGQVFGSTSLLVRRTSPNNVTGVDDGIVISLTPAELDWLIEARPTVAARLLKALAAGLASRTIGQPLGAGAVHPVTHVAPQSGGLSRLAAACREARIALAGLGTPPDDDQVQWTRERIPAVSSTYRPVLRAVAAYVEDTTGDERESRLTEARKELFALAGGSRLVERMRSRPTGSAAGYRFFNHIYRNLPSGDDVAGLLTDAWLLTRPFAEAIRERRSQVSERLGHEALLRARPDQIFRILSLGCGPARSLADILEEPGMADKISVTCVDDDQEALVQANNLLKSRAPRGDITFRLCAPGSLQPDADGYGGYDVVASLYAADHADVSQLGRMLFVSHRWLHAHGHLDLVVFGDAVPDWLLLEALFDWRPWHPTARDLLDVAARSAFGHSKVTVTSSPSGLNLFLRAVK